ncbi:MAG: hypothetical protein ACLT8E_01060 [Akkermansia sp.]
MDGTLAGAVYSATKGASSAALSLALHRQSLTADEHGGTVAGIQPYASIAQMMSHQCGLAAFSRTPACLTMRTACAPWRKPFRRGGPRARLPSAYLRRDAG